MRSSTWLIIFIGVVVAGGAALVVLNEPVKNAEGFDCGTALHAQQRFTPEFNSDGVFVPTGPDLCAGAADSNRSQAELAAGVILLLAAGIAVYDHSTRSRRGHARLRDQPPPFATPLQPEDEAETARWESQKEEPAFVCPRCGTPSWNPNNDARNRYCGRCHWWTGDPVLGSPEALEAAERDGAIVPLDKR